MTLHASFIILVILSLHHVGGIFAGDFHSQSLMLQTMTQQDIMNQRIDWARVRSRALLFNQHPNNMLQLHELGPHGLHQTPAVPALVVRGGDGSGGLAVHFRGHPSRCWIALMISILVDCCTAPLMKLAQEEASLNKMIAAYCGYSLSLFGFGLSLNSLDISIAYSVWAALGTAIVSAIGIVRFNEGYNTMKIICLSLIILGVVGLNLQDS